MSFRFKVLFARLPPTGVGESDDTQKDEAGGADDRHKKEMTELGLGQTRLDVDDGGVREQQKKHTYTHASHVTITLFWYDNNNNATLQVKKPDTLLMLITFIIIIIA